MLPVWIVYASNFDLNIPECHIRDSSLSLYIFNSIGAQYHDMKLSLYRYRYVSQIPTRVCAIYVPLCACVLVCVCVYAHVSSSALWSMSRYTAVVVHLIHIQVCDF